MKKYFSCGRIIEGFVILPSINYNWMLTSFGKTREFQFAWLFWYFSIGNVKIMLEKMK